MTSSLSRFSEDQFIIGGRDIFGGGSWFLFNQKTGNIAFLTNLSSKFDWQPRESPKSRGTVIYEFVRSDFYEKHSEFSLDKAGLLYLEQVANNLKEYNGFSVVVGNLLTEFPAFFYLDYLTSQVHSIEYDKWIGLSNSPLH